MIKNLAPAKLGGRNLAPESKSSVESTDDFDAELSETDEMSTSTSQDPPEPRVRRSARPYSSVSDSPRVASPRNLGMKGKQTNSAIDTGAPDDERVTRSPESEQHFAESSRSLVGYHPP